MKVEKNFSPVVITLESAQDIQTLHWALSIAKETQLYNNNEECRNLIKVLLAALS
jgi:hypothetical protein